METKIPVISMKHNPANEDINKCKKNHERNQRRKIYFLNFMSIVSGYILMLDVGATMTWTSPSLPYLKSEESHITLSGSEESWLVSIDNLTSIVGHLLYAVLIDRIGRRNSLLLFGIIHLSSWILINIAYNFTFLCIARLMIGLAYGGSVVTFHTYVGEISGKDIRGILLALVKISMNVGAFLMVIAGAFLPYMAMNLVMLLLPIFALLFFPFMPETPYFYLMKGRDEEAIKTLTKLSEVKDMKLVMEEIDRMKKSIEEQEKSTENIIKNLLRDRGSRKAFIIVTLAALTYGFSGFIAIRAVAQEVLSLSNSSIKPEYQTILLMGLQIFAGLPVSQLIDRWGRRPIYLLSGTFSALSLLIVGLFFFLKDFIGTDVSSITWLPLTGLIMYMIIINLGVSIMALIYGGELFPVKVKGFSLMVTYCVLDLSIFVSKMILQNLNNAGYIYIALWIFLISCLIAPITVWFTMPETKGKNLEEILILMNAKHNKNSC